MVTKSEVLRSSRGGIYNQYDKDLDRATGASFATALTIDCKPIRESVIVIHNNDVGDLDWQILANANRLSEIIVPNGTDDDDDGWVIIQSGSIATTVVPTVVTFSNPWTQLVIQTKHTTATTNVDIWHRGEN